MRGLARHSLAESITAYGRYSLQTTWDIAKERNLHPIYGDTDSLFLDDPSEEQVKWLIRMVKERLRLDLAVDEWYSVFVLPNAMKSYFGIRRDGTSNLKGLTAIKSNSPLFIQEVFKDCVKEIAKVENQPDFEEAKKRIQKIVDEAIKDLRTGAVPLKDLEYSVELHEDPRKTIRDKTWHQPYQCAIQLIDSGQSVQRRDIVKFVKVKPFPYREKTFTVKPTEQIKNLHEVNVEDYIRNLRTALNQTFKPMDLHITGETGKKTSLSDFL
jgi:DNA polymerase I